MLMLKILTLTFVCALTSVAQVTSPFQGLVDAYRLASEIRTNQALQNTLNAEAEAIRADTERRRSNNQALAAAAAASQKVDRNLGPALQIVRSRYPDFDEYQTETARLMGELDTNNTGLNLEHYIEGFYLIAKHASFSPRAIAPKESPALALTRAPEFHSLPIATRVRFAKAVEPELAKIADDDLEVLLTAIALKAAKGAAK